jgi:hypothetical protein
MGTRAKQPGAVEKIPLDFTYGDIDRLPEGLLGEHSISSSLAAWWRGSGEGMGFGSETRSNLLSFLPDQA